MVTFYSVWGVDVFVCLFINVDWCMVLDAMLDEDVGWIGSGG